MRSGSFVDKLFPFSWMSGENSEWNIDFLCFCFGLFFVAASFTAQKSPFIEKKKSNSCLGLCSVLLNNNQSLIHDNFRWSKTPLGKLKARAVELENEARAEKEISEAKKKAAAGKSWIECCRKQVHRFSLCTFCLPSQINKVKLQSKISTF